MADAVYISRNTAFAATAGAKTALKLITPTTYGIEIHEISVSFDGVTSSAVPATVETFTSDETTAGTQVGTSVTTQIRGTTIAHGLTVGQNFSAEGTTYAINRSWYVPQYMGLLVVQNPLGVSPTSPVGAADSYGIRINVTANVNCLVYVVWSRS